MSGSEGFGSDQIPSKDVSDQSSNPLRRPGWYDDPNRVYEHQAYWNGEKWTGKTRSDPGQLQWTAVVSVIIGIIAVIGSLPWWIGAVGSILATSALTAAIGVFLTGSFLFVGLLRGNRSLRSRRWLWTGFGLGLVAVAPPVLWVGSLLEGL